MRVHRLGICVFLGIATIAASALWADTPREVDAVIARDEAPPGVVFEIAQSQEAALTWALPQIKAYAQRLRARFPDLKMAVVTHGKEEFALLESNTKKYSDVHTAVRDLVDDQDIPVHVCGTHASWVDKHPEDFPKYVDVAPSGPAQIRNYRELGYVLVVIRPSKP